MGKHVVYIRALEESELKAAGFDPGEWVRGLVKSALDARSLARSDVPLPAESAAKAAKTMTDLTKDVQ